MLYFLAQIHYKVCLCLIKNKYSIAFCFTIFLVLYLVILTTVNFLQNFFKTSLAFILFSWWFH